MNSHSPRRKQSKVTCIVCNTTVEKDGRGNSVTCGNACSSVHKDAGDRARDHIKRYNSSIDPAGSYERKLQELREYKVLNYSDKFLRERLIQALAKLKSEETIEYIGRKVDVKYSEEDNAFCGTYKEGDLTVCICADTLIQAKNQFKESLDAEFPAEKNS